MLDHGHPDAWTYPVGMLAVESEYVTRRLDAELAHQVGLMQMMVSSIPNSNVKANGTKEAASKFYKTLKAMINGQ